jgi:RNA polymerase sigma-70 factor (ECF subfamily)
VKGGENVPDFEKVFQENQTFIFRYLMKLCKDSSLAEELTQETFFRAYMNLTGLRNEEKITIWLCQIAKNTYFSWCRENKNRQSVDDLEISDDSADLADFFATKELSTKAFSCLHSLCEPYKEVFMLSVFGGLSLKQISELFGKSESWARVTFYRAKQKLLEEMKHYGM